MSSSLSRTMSAATLGYGAFALVRPAHLWQALQADRSDRSDRSGLELLARTFGVRDTAISALGLFGRSERVVRAAMVLRIAMDLGDAVVLSAWVDDPRTRAKVLGVTLTWAGLNTAALLADTRRAGSAG